MKIRQKLLLAFTLLALPPLLLTVLANAFIVTPLTMRNSVELERKTLAQYRSEIEDRMEFFDNLTKIIMRDEANFNRLSDEYDSILNVTLAYIDYFNKYADTYAQLNENITTVCFYVDNPSLNKDMLNIRDITHLQADESLYQALTQGRYGHYARLDDGDLKIYRVLNYFNKKSGAHPVVEFTVSKNELISAVSGAPTDDIFVADPESNLLQLSGNQESQSVIAEELDQMSEISGILDRNDTILIYDTTATGWRVIKVVTPSASFTEARNTRNLIDFLVLLFAVVMLVLILLISNHLSFRMRKLTDKLMQVRGGQYHDLKPISGRDEIATASAALDALAGEFSHLIETEYQWKLDVTQLKLDLAYARINPHFLYNTLDAIDWYIRRGDTDTSINLIQSLAIFYRKSLNLGSDVVLVADELMHLEIYLAIEQMMNDGIQTVVEVPDELRDVRVNALTLQPLVENAIQHAPTGGSEPLNIRVWGYTEADQAVLVVEDDGVGFSREAARTFNSEHCVPANATGVGLANVHARIRMRFGEDYGLTIVEKDTPGAEVHVVLPLADRGGPEEEWPGT